MPFPDFQPHLSGQLVALRPLHSSDFDMLYLIASDPLIWEQHPERNRYLPEVFRKFFATAIDSQGAFCVTDIATDAIIGSTRFYDYDEVSGNVAIGYTFLCRAYWAAGYNKDMKRLMIDHAFTFAKSISFHVGNHNHRSQKAVLKTGATIYKESTDGIEYRLTQKDWKSNTGYLNS